MAKQRLDKLLSHEGFGSRKDIKKLLRNSKVTVKGTLSPSMTKKSAFSNTFIL